MPAAAGLRADITRNFGGFYLALLVGAVVWLATWGQHRALRILLAGDLMFAVYVGLMIAWSMRLTAADLQENARNGLRGAAPPILLAALAVLLSLVAVFTLLNHPTSEGRLFPILAVASVPLTWAMIHAISAFVYARLYYAPKADGTPAGGLAFPHTDAPNAMDFLYHAFVMGVSFSVSDVAVSSTPMRVATMIHSLCSFVFNTVLIAIAVNAAMTFTR